MFDISKLQNITLNDKNVLEPFLQNLSEASCEMSFANLVMWHEAYQTQFAFDTKNRLILYSPVEKMLYFPRGAEITVEELYELNKLFVNASLTENLIYDVPEEYILSHNDIDNFFNIDFNEDNFDYLYDNQKLTDCSGSKLRKKRNLIKQFLNNNPAYSVSRLDESNTERFLSIALKLNSQLESCDFLSDEDKVMTFACRNFRNIPLDGIILNDGSGNDIGFAIWSKLNQDIADIHFEKADHSVKGAAQFLTQQVAAILASNNINFMNREQDLGDPGIRRAKHSLDPAFLYRRASICGKF